MTPNKRKPKLFTYGEVAGRFPNWTAGATSWFVELKNRILTLESQTLPFDMGKHVLQISVTVFKDGHVHQDAHQPTPKALQGWSEQRKALVLARDSIDRLIKEGADKCPYSPKTYDYE